MPTRRAEHRQSPVQGQERRGKKGKAQCFLQLRHTQPKRLALRGSDSSMSHRGRQRGPPTAHEEVERESSKDPRKRGGDRRGGRGRQYSNRNFLLWTYAFCDGLGKSESRLLAGREKGKLKSGPRKPCGVQTHSCVACFHCYGPNIKEQHPIPQHDGRGRGSCVVAF